MNNMLVAISFLLLTASTASTKQFFPETFKFGVATSSYQIEGSWNIDGRTPSIWDYQTHTFPERIEDGSNGDIACDSYNKIDEDVRMIKELKVDFYRFSLSWTRILPTGYSNVINQKGVEYYNKLIDELIANNIEPLVTLYHWDLPQNFQELGGWTNSEIIGYFAEYARVCFKLFGDRVKTWITINEPSLICRYGYGLAVMAPFYPLDGTGSYLCGHNLILAHAKAYRIYEKEFKYKQQGRIGISIETPWFEPNSNSSEDIRAANDLIQIYYGWFAHPIYSATGDYPPSMRRNVDFKSKSQNFIRSRLPHFTKEEIKTIRGSHDFLGLNHYNTYLVTPDINCDTLPPAQMKDSCTKFFPDPAWEETASDAMQVVPWGLRKLLNWIRLNYNNVNVIITENGYNGDANGVHNDDKRIKYFSKYLAEVLKALNDGCNIEAYTFWSLMDNFEWSDGYTKKFGLYEVDFNSPNRTRTPKLSASEYRKIIVERKVNKHYIDY